MLIYLLIKTYFILIYTEIFLKNNLYNNMGRKGEDKINRGYFVFFNIIILLMIVQTVYSIEGKSGNYTLTIENVEGINFEEDKEGQNNLLIMAAILIVITLILLIIRIKNIKGGKK